MGPSRSHNPRTALAGRAGSLVLGLMLAVPGMLAPFSAYAAGSPWSAAGTMAQAREWHTATALPDGKVLIAGGYGPGGLLSSAELYDPATGSWSSAGTMSQRRFLHTATALPDGKVLVAGGHKVGGPLSSAELYDPNFAAA